MPLTVGDGFVAADQPAVVWRPWRCERGQCNAILMEIDYRRPAAIRKKCEKCGHMNVWVETYRPSGSW
jgi:hypothetical protein